MRLTWRRILVSSAVLIPVLLMFGRVAGSGDPAGQAGPYHAVTFYVA